MPHINNRHFPATSASTAITRRREWRCAGSCRKTCRRLIASDTMAAARSEGCAVFCLFVLFKWMPWISGHFFLGKRGGHCCFDDVFFSSFPRLDNLIMLRSFSWLWAEPKKKRSGLMSASEMAWTASVSLFLTLMQQWVGRAACCLDRALCNREVTGLTLVTPQQLCVLALCPWAK